MCKTLLQATERKKATSKVNYHLIVKGVIKEEMAGTTEKPTLLLKTGNTEESIR